MIDSKELKIGNWFKYVKTHSENEEENGWTYESIEDGCDIDSVCIIGYPIPLTEKILVDVCGFVNKNDEYRNAYQFTDGYNFYEHADAYFIVSERDGIFYKYNHIDDDCFYSWHGVEVKYLHQLQNLYFALTNTELEINEEKLKSIL